MVSTSECPEGQSGKVYYGMQYLHCIKSNMQSKAIALSTLLTWGCSSGISSNENYHLLQIFRVKGHIPENMPPGEGEGSESLGGASAWGAQKPSNCQ